MSDLMFPTRNNLEILRLAFAAQVMVVHVAAHLGYRFPKIVTNFPGVPAFFFVSGFLIYASYLNAPGKRYLENRFLRLYPALVLVTFGGLGVAVLAHGWQDIINNYSTYLLWFFAQTTIGQAYNPSLFRDIGIGVINGSLWTLTTEMLFYVSVPLIVWLERRYRFAVLGLTIVSFIFYGLGPYFWVDPVYREKTVFDVVALTPIAWGWMFGFGILAVKHFDLVQRTSKYQPVAFLPIAMMILLSQDGPLFNTVGNRLGLFYFASYVFVVLWLAFAIPVFRLRFDFSYGIYIWHAPVVNFLLVLAIPNPVLGVVLTITMAAFSWFVVEKPALRLKRQSLKSVG